MDYNLKRQNRKSVTLCIKNGSVEVRAPLTMKKSEIERFVSSKENWIKKHLTAQKELCEQKRRFSIGYGSELLLRGAGLLLTAEPGADRAWLDEKGFHLPDGLAPDVIELTVKRLYRLYCESFLTDRVRHYADIMRVSPLRVKITDAKTRWGSCNSGKSICFSWRLIMAGDEAIDAVVVHELAHMKHMNHSRQFYSEVRSVLPDYSERSKKLKALSLRLSAENW